MAYMGPFPISVPDGGTGDATLTLHSLLLGNGTSAITSLGVATNGQLPIGSTGSNPVLATITAGSGITVTNGAGTITLAATGATASSFPTDSGTATPSAGALTIHGGLNLTTSGSGATVTIAETQAVLLNNYTAVNHAASPYTVLVTDYYISADVTAGVITINLPNAPTTNRVFIIKDKVGLSATSNITVTTVGGAVTIDGATTFVINTNFESVNLAFNGTSYEVF
jgi:trimeric autotransporter adhesin